MAEGYKLAKKKNKKYLKESIFSVKSVPEYYSEEEIDDADYAIFSNESIAILVNAYKTIKEDWEDVCDWAEAVELQEWDEGDEREMVYNKEGLANSIKWLLNNLKSVINEADLNYFFQR